MNDVRISVDRDVKNLEPRPSPGRAKAVARRLLNDIRGLNARVPRDKVQRLLRRTAVLLKHLSYRSALLLLVAQSAGVAKKSGAKLLYETIASHVPGYIKSSPTAYYLSLIKTSLAVAVGARAAGKFKKAIEENLGIAGYDEIRVPSHRRLVSFTMKS